MGSVFEEMCRYYTLEKGIQGAYGSFLTQTGTWWGVEQIIDDEGRKFTQSADIDVVGISSVDKTAVIGECKFKNEKFDKSELEKVMDKIKYLPTKELTICLFSLSFS